MTPIHQSGRVKFKSVTTHQAGEIQGSQRQLIISEERIPGWYTYPKSIEFIIPMYDNFTDVNNIEVRYKYAFYSDFAKRTQASEYQVIECIKFAMHNNKQFSFGRDLNLYGGHLSTGLRLFKAKFSALPHLNASTPIYSLYPEIDIAGIEFYIINAEELVLVQTRQHNV
jgi:hypothetical protein